MHIRTHTLYLLLAVAVAVSLTACDQSSQKIDFGSGSNLTLEGPSRITYEGFQANRDTAEYMVSAYTINQEYSWTVTDVAGGDKLGSPGQADYSRRDQGNDGNPEVVGEYSEGPRTYTVEVSTTIDGQEYTGTVTTKADYRTFSGALGPAGLTTARSLVTSAGLAAPLDNDGPISQTNTINGWTAFVPNNAAIIGALDANGNGSIDGAELPAPGILGQILRYHVAAQDSITTTEISGQSVPTALHPQETLTVNASGVQASNGTANYTNPDIAASDGVIHATDRLMLPNGLISINNQTVGRGSGAPDTIDVEGAFLSDGGFIALHKGSPSGNIIGSSGYLSDGFYGNTGPVPVTLNSALSDSSQVVAIPYRDNGDQLFNPGTGPGQDPPYVRGSSNTPVASSAGVDTP